MYLTLFIASLLIATLTTYIYKNIWNLFYNKNKIPTGYGLFLILFFYLYSFFFSTIDTELVAFSIILFFSLIYWVDDLLHLPFIFRFLLQFVCGCAIAIYLLIHAGNNIDVYFYTIVIFSGLINIFLSNVINFYDGLDLNISTLIFILGITIIFLADQSIIDIKYGFIIIGFTFGFSIFNFKPDNIFFGDSGCFVVASFINFLLIKSILVINLDIIYLIIPLALPIIDVLYVIILRIYKNESLLSRNYHHLYHQLQSRFNNKTYIIPQIFNAMALFIISKIVITTNIFDLKQNLLFILISLLFTIITYVLFKNLIRLKN